MWPSIRLKDKFGDNGLISVVAGHIDNEKLNIDLWLMSCRVFKRGVEHLLANYLFTQARSTGIKTVYGRYIPTEKNKLVENLYADLGFDCVSTSEQGETDWRMDVDDYQPFPVQISLQEEMS